MKKVFCLLLALGMVLSLFVGCAEEEQEVTTTTTTSQTEEVKLDTSILLHDMHLSAETIAPYEGPYWEDATGEQVSGIYAMKFTNIGEQCIRSAQLIFGNGTNELVFWLEMLPAGQSVIVAEQRMVPVAQGKVHFVDGTVSYVEEGLENTACVELVKSGDGVLQFKNTTDELLPLVRIFYRLTDGEGTLLGGPCYSTMIDGIEAGSTASAEAEHWTEDCAIVTVLVVNE